MIPEGFWTGLLVGAAATFVSLMIVFWFAMPRGKTANERTKLKRNATPPALALLMVALGGFALMFGQATPTFAQSTPVALDIPTDVIFTQANNWISTLAPVSAIGIGVAIATAVLGYVGVMIVKGFKGGF